MRKALVMVVGLLAGLGFAQGTSSAAPSAPEESGYGSCYEVKPLCLQGKPACLCDYAMKCFWACR